MAVLGGGQPTRATKNSATTLEPVRVRTGTSTVTVGETIIRADRHRQPRGSAGRSRWAFAARDPRERTLGCGRSCALPVAPPSRRLAASRSPPARLEHPSVAAEDASIGPGQPLGAPCNPSLPNPCAPAATACSVNVCVAGVCTQFIADCRRSVRGGRRRRCRRRRPLRHQHGLRRWPVRVPRGRRMLDHGRLLPCERVERHAPSSRLRLRRSAGSVHHERLHRRAGGEPGPCVDGGPDADGGGRLGARRRDAGSMHRRRRGADASDGAPE